MATLTQYSFTQQVDYSTMLSNQIQQSSISTTLDHIDTSGSGTTMAISVWFKDVLSDVDVTTLNSIMFAYTNPTPTLSSSNLVTTQFELRDKTLKLANVSGAVQSDGTVVVYLLIPGTANPTGDITQAGRWISSGTAFFDIATPGDLITSVRFVDHDNIIGQGVDFIVGSYTDDSAPSANQGWYIPPSKGQLTAEAIGGYGFAPAGFYIMITAKKGNGLVTGTLYVNIEWANLGN